ncbi:MAG TPA: hypothetical protein VLJ42_11645 [Solirubrobacteraceae bacterium]|nr:hypothetical protein [Solirubrobacteraceae bacterium]
MPKAALGPVAARKPVVALVLVAALSALWLPAPASADVTSTIISQCAHGQTPSGFSQAAYRKALQKLPTEVGEYSDCVKLIHRAQIATATGASSRSSTSGASALPGTAGADTSGAALSTPITSVERTALSRAHRGGSAPVQVDGAVVHPGVVHADIASAFSSLPTPLLVILLLLLVSALLLGGAILRNRVRTRRNS